MMGRWERIDPKCDRRRCLYQECGYCTILNSTDFGDRECTFYRPRDTRKEFVEGQAQKINDMWRNKK